MQSKLWHIGVAALAALTFALPRPAVALLPQITCRNRDGSSLVGG